MDLAHDANGAPLDYYNLKTALACWRGKAHKNIFGISHSLVFSPNVETGTLD
jgi:hypothetical protein